MKMNDSREIAATPEAVWAAILDPEVLKQCIPGCESMEGSPEEGFDATVVQKVGPVKAKFSGKVNLEDMNPPNSVKLVGEGKGGAAGFAKGEATVTLAPSDTGTTLTYDVDAKVAEIETTTADILELGKTHQSNHEAAVAFARARIDAGGMTTA